jgi:DNA-binding GntR family transcriptional regulator
MVKAIQHRSLGEKTYTELKNLIVSGQIKPGERLFYQQLVEQLGVSQTPIKEAFTKLENEGYLVTIPRKGTFVRELSAKEIREIFQIREMLEALAVRLMCRLPDGKGTETLIETNKRFRSAYLKKDLKACTREDYNFHETIIKLSGNEKLFDLMTRSNLHLLSIAQGSPNFLDIAAEYYKKHAEIIEAIQKHEEKAAEQLIREHIGYGQEQVLRFMNRTVLI